MTCADLGSAKKKPAKKEPAKKEPAKKKPAKKKPAKKKRNPFGVLQSLEEAERILREVLGAEAGTALEDLSTSGKAENASEAHELHVKLTDLVDAVHDLMASDLIVRMPPDTLEAECDKYTKFFSAVAYQHVKVLKRLEVFRQADAEALRREHRKKEDEKKALHRLGNRKSYYWGKLCAGMEELRQLGGLSACITISLVKNHKGQEKMQIRTHLAGTAHDSPVHAVVANFEKELRRLEASGELEPVFEEMRRAKNSFLKRACPPSEAPSRTTQQGNKRPKCTGEAEAASPVQNAATVVRAPAPEPAPAPARAPAAETTGAVAEVSDTGPPGPSDAVPASLLAEA